MYMYALLNPNIADANSGLSQSCESTIRVSTYCWHEAVWSVGLLLNISSAYVDRWVELFMISCLYLKILTIEALFSPYPHSDIACYCADGYDPVP